MPPADSEIAWFLFTDIEGSTARWEQHPDAMPHALARHDALLADACASAGGTVFKQTGDGVVAVFREPSGAVAAAVLGQLGLARESFADVGDLRVRMGVHGGKVHRRDGDFFGSTLNRAARVMGVAHGGQIVVTDSAREQVAGLDRQLDPEVAFVDLGLHRLKGVTGAERLHQVCHPDLPRDFAALSSMNMTLGNLTAAADRVLGRQRQLEHICSLLAEGRLVTLVGPGGVGKTALAQHVGRSLVNEYPDGVWFCDLSDVRDDHLVAATIARVVGVDRRVGETIEDTLRDVLAARQLLLIVDNCEHLVAEVARIVSAIRVEQSTSRVLTTSRTLLGLPAEARVTIDPLPTPGETRDADNLRGYASVQLFVERAAEVGHRLELDSAERDAVARICNELDGLPLAIELAAARTKVLSVTDIADRLDRRLRLLSRASAGDARRRTLEATLDWSYDLLAPDEQDLFQLLGAFDSGFELAAVVDVAELEEFDALDLLQGLVDKSIVVSTLVGDRVRYRLLEVVREYAVARLDRRDNAAAVKERHARHYAQLVHDAQPRLRSDEEPDCLDELRREVANLRRSFEWLLAADPDAAAQMPLGLWPLWTARNLTDEGIGWFERARHALPPDHPLLARVLDDLASLLWNVGENAAGETACLASIDAARRRGAEPPPTTLLRLASIRAFAGNTGDATKLTMETLDRVRNDRVDAEAEAHTVSILCVIGVMLTMCGDAEQGARVCDEGLEAVRGLGPGLQASACCNAALAYLPTSAVRSLELANAAAEYARELRSTYSMGNALQALGLAQRVTGDHSGSMQTCAEALVYLRDTGMRNAVVEVLECVADQLREAPEARTTLYGAASRLREEIASGGLVEQQVAITRRLDRLRDALGDERFESAWHTGMKLGFDESIDFACSVVEDLNPILVGRG